MTDTDDADRQTPTRRQCVKYGAAAVAGGLVAGCLGDDGSGSDGDDNDGSGADDGSQGDGTPSNDSTADDGIAGSYEACIEPAGCVEFETVPETYIVNNGEWADMAFALGQRDGFLTATTMIPGFLFEPFGLDVPAQSATTSLDTTNWDKEVFYEEDPDVILMDPNYMHATGWDSAWDESDTREISENVAPFFGNNILRRREWHDYRLYSLYEAFERLADAFQERERFEAIDEIHAELQAEIQSRLPPEEERPSVALINSASSPHDGTFYPMHTQAEGVETKPYRDLGVGSVFSAELAAGGSIDYEVLLDLDPDVVVVHWGIGTTGGSAGFSPSAFEEQFVAPFEEHTAGSQLTAVQNGEIHPGAYGSQGPLVNLLQTEMVAQQLYPEAFGAFDQEAFPEVPEANRLFDRERVAAIVDGDV